MELLYISYDGMLEPLGQSQVVSYLTRLARDHQIHLISFEKRHDLRDCRRLGECSETLRRAGIRWRALRYHKRPTGLAKIRDLCAGVAAGIGVCRNHPVRLVHARGYLPSAMALILKRFFRVKFLFDMRGFWPEEKADAGHWSRRGWMYRAAKRWERRFFEQADGIVSLTQAGVNAFPSLGYCIPSSTRIEVIPTCVDLERFSPGSVDEEWKGRLGLEEGTVIGCVGNLSGWYLREETLRYVAFLLQNGERAQALFVTQEDPDALKAAAAAAGIPPQRRVVARAVFQEMPSYLRCMDLGVFFIQPRFSKKGSAATKLAEFLSCGVPVVINQGVGDSGRIVQEEGVGIVLPEPTSEEFQRSLGRVQELLGDPDCKERCRAAARRYFDLEIGSRRYAALYTRLGSG